MTIPKEKLKLAADQSDDKFIEAAVAGNAECIISGDKHLLQLKEYKGIKMRSPAEFLKLMN